MSDITYLIYFVQMHEDFRLPEFLSICQLHVSFHFPLSFFFLGPALIS